ncbi:MAG: glycoside hydrolase family 43 protein [Jatrophihabitans sp.]|uniref:glycoside hydrolase family 43 protein n=1 Tax=Jatrophihabitans sp. TaxID=1932789 RepID=UPI00391301BD
MPRRLGVISAAAAVLTVAACGGSSRGADKSSNGSTAPATAAAGGYVNPVYDQDFPDPAVLRVGTTYHAYGTQGAGKNIQTLSSPDLVHWRPGGDALPQLGSWADAGNTWAPEVITLGSTYVMYYVARSADRGVQCIGRATASAPGGPFTDTATRPLVCQASLGGSIDADPIRAKDGSLYLYWKNDGNCCGKPVHLWGQRLSADGAALVGRPVALMTNAKAWQGNLVEAPEMVAHGRGYVLFYSANNYASADYGIGYATCRTPLGPCTDRSNASIIASDDVAAGPGHCYVVVTTSGATWLLYHAWPAGAIGSTTPGRQLWLEPVTWRGDVPSVHPSQAGPQPAPR